MVMSSGVFAWEFAHVVNSGVELITKFLSIINLSFDFRVGGIYLFMTVVMYILFYMYCLLLYP
jgi:hypothetical protein